MTWSGGAIRRTRGSDAGGSIFAGLFFGIEILVYGGKIVTGRRFGIVVVVADQPVKYGI